MLPGRSIGISKASGKVHSRSDMGRENAADGGADTVALGSGDADCGVRTLRADAKRRRADQLPDGVAGRRRTARSRNRMAGPPRAGSSPHGLASIPGRRRGRLEPTHSAGSSTSGHACLAGRVAAGHRAGSTSRGCAQRGMDDSAVVGVSGTRHWPRNGDRDGADPSASPGLCVQTADVVHEAQVDRTGWVGKKRLKVEVLLAAAAAPVPPPIDELLPDLGLRDEVADDLPWLVRLLPRADVYLQDEVEIALHPTLTRVWSPKGRRRQRLVEAPGNNEKQYA